MFSVVLLKQQLPKHLTLITAHKYAITLSVFDHLHLGILSLYVSTRDASTFWHFLITRQEKSPRVK